MNIAPWPEEITDLILEHNDEDQLARIRATAELHGFKIDTWVFIPHVENKGMAVFEINGVAFGVRDQTMRSVLQLRSKGRWPITIINGERLCVACRMNPCECVDCIPDQPEPKLSKS